MLSHSGHRRRYFPVDQPATRGRRGLSLRRRGRPRWPAFPALVREMKRVQWLPQTDLEARAVPRLARLLKHAAKNAGRANHRRA
jgi:hypothetical protein